MRPFRAIRWVGALVLMVGGVAPAHAAWDNVFQVCCFGCRNRTSNFRPAITNYSPAVSYYAWP